MSQNISAEEPQRRALERANAEIARLRAQLAASEGDMTAREPIAIVGMGCRYPGGVKTPAEFWELLSSGRDILRDIPGERWNVDAHYHPEMTVPGKMYVRRGYYLDDIDQFDPQFFGLSPREAESLDPQQRLVMEVSWETLENSGISPSTLQGGKTGVFVGQYWDDYSSQRIFSTDNREIDRYAQLSSLRGLTAGRICHILDSHGPAIQLDTACSSSSLAVHLACQSLRTGESDLALAGGVSLILAPEHLIGICQMNALSPDGRCKTFDVKADGFGQGEGCGMIALKRLSDAKSSGDNVLAVIQGTAVNHDGHARTVTSPSGPAQRAMLQEALDDAGLKPDQIDYIETHGTGTPLGDPIEVSAIARVLCENRTKPLYLGSVKTNVGHLDSAAGVVGLMKVVLSLQHCSIPPHLNYSEPNPHIPWKDWPLNVPTENTPWRGENRFAGISAFGMSGTNVHLIVGEAPQPIAKNAKPRNQTPSDVAPPYQLMILSAQASSALRELAARYATAIDAEIDGDLGQFCFSAAIGRSHLSHRAAFLSDSRETLAQSLREFAAGDMPPSVSMETIGRRAPKLAFLFTGQGAQYVGMGKGLYEACPSFREWIDRCAELLEPHLEYPLIDVLWTGEGLHQTVNTQPALFAIEYSLAKVYEEWGVIPDLLIGHSIGEYVAACIAGVFSLEDALRLVAARGRLMQSLPAGGEMFSAATNEATVRDAIAAASRVSIAAVNAPQSTVLSGDGQAVKAVVERLNKQGVKTTALKVSHAFHSPMMEPILDEFRAVAESADFNPPDKTLISNVTGKPWNDAQLSAEYWVEQMHDAVRFSDAMAYAESKKFQVFVEVGPRPTLLGLGRACMGPGNRAWLPGLKPDSEWPTLLQSIAELHVRGVGINWARFYRRTGFKQVQLPNYPWRYQRCWTDVVSTGGNGQRLHPLVHRRIENASSSLIFESRISAANPAYLDDHRLFDTVVYPASAFFEMAMVAARTIFQQDEVTLTNVSIGRALLLSETPTTVQIIATPNADRFDFEISSRTTESSAADWVQHTAGTLERRLPSSPASIDIKATLTDFTEEFDITELSERFEARGLEYFPRFQAIETIYKQGSSSSDDFGNAFARLELPLEANVPGDSYRLHPVITDAGFRIAEAIFPNEEPEKIYLPFGISGFSCDHAASGTVWVKATARQEVQTRVVDLELFDDDGVRIATVEKLTLRSVPIFNLKQTMTKPRTSGEVLNEWLYQFEWEQTKELAGETGEADGDWLVLQGFDGVAGELIRQMEATGQRVHIAEDPAAVDAIIESEDVQSLSKIVHLWGMDASEKEPDKALLASLQVLQSLIQARVTGKHWFVTKGAQAVAADDDISPWQTRFWGLARTIQVEHPKQLGGCVDLHPNLSSQDIDDLSLLIAELGQSNPDTEVAFREGIRYVARLARPAPCAQTVDPHAPLKLDPESSYLLTGGLGSLGLLVAQYLATCGAKHLVLTGRSGVSTDDQRNVLHTLKDAGVKVDVVPADISNADDVERVLAIARNLRGIVHAAGILDDGMLMQQNAERFTKVARPKVDGAWHLHSQTLNQSLDFFVLFSSVASVIGSPGQSNYASANAFLDGLAHHRKNQGLAATTINWGPWADVGMAASNVVSQRLIKDGWQPINATQGYNFISHLLTARDLPQAAIIPLDWGQFSQNTPGAGDWSTLKRLVLPHGSSPLTLGSAESGAERAKAAAPGERVDWICSYLLERIAQTLRVPATNLNEYAQLTELGIDSLTAVELCLWIQGDLGVEPAIEQLFTTPSIRHLAIEIGQMLDGQTSVTKNSDGNTRADKPQWMVCPQPRPNAQFRLICFPYAGGGASAFKDWGDATPEHIELCVVQLPGREERLGEPLMTNMAALVDALTNEIVASTDRPFALLGHSMGAIIAYEVTCQLRAKGAIQPQHLFVSARAAPHLEGKGEPLRSLENDQFIERLHQAYGAVPEAIRNSVELQKVFIPILRADVELLETHIDTAADPLECPISALGGTSDPAISATMLAGWREHTSANFVQHQFPGDHFYIYAERDAVMAAVVDTLSAYQ